MSRHKEIIMCWIPSHIGVSGNKRAGSAAKSALDLCPDNTSIPYTDLKPQMNRFFVTKWQQCWNDSINNKLFQTKPTFGRMETTISKIKNGTSHYIQTAYRSYKTHPLFHPKAGTTTTMFDMPDALHH